MPASFPASAKTFTDKADLIDIINAVDVNDLQNEVAAIEAEALNQTGVFITTTKTNTATAKSTPVDADAMPMLDSQASNVLKKLTWAYLKSNLKTYFDTLYSTLASMSAANAATLTAGATSDADALHTHTGISIPTNNAENLYRCVASPGGASAWTGTFTAAGSSGTTIKYATVTGTAAAMTPYATTHLCKMRLYNTTRSNYVLIANHVAGTITSVANYPGDWQNGDALSIDSALCTGNGFVDLEITSVVTGISGVYALMQLTNNTAGQSMFLHPYSSFSAAKFCPVTCTVAGSSFYFLAFIPVTSNLFCLAWTGTPSTVLLKLLGYTTP